MPTLAELLADSGLELEDVYTGNRSWSDLLADAGLGVRASGPNERELRRAVGRLLHVDGWRAATTRKMGVERRRS